MSSDQLNAMEFGSALIRLCLESSSQEEILQKTMHGVNWCGQIYDVSKILPSIKEFYRLPEKRERSTDAS